MDKLKQYVTFTVLGCVAVLAAGWFLAVSPKRAQAADLQTQTAAQVSSNAQLMTQLQVLKSQARDLPKQQAQLAKVAAKIPDNPAMPALVRALVVAADSAGVELVSVTPGQPALVAAPAAAAVPATAPNAAAANAAAQAPVVAGAAPAARVASANAGQLASIPLTLNIAGGYFQTEQFVANLENLPRSMRIVGLTLTPGDNPVKKQQIGATTLTTTITGEVYMAANRSAVAPVTAPGQPAAAPVAPAAPVTVNPAKK